MLLLMKKLLNIFNLYELVFVLISLFLLIGLGIFYLINNFTIIGIFELVSVILGLLAATLNGKKKKYAFYFYTIYVIIYGTVSFINKQYGEGILNIIFNLPMYLYTLYKFYLKKDINNSSDNKDFKISKIKKWMVITIIIFIPVMTLVYGLILDLINSNYPFLNAFATSIALCAVFLTSKGILEQWYFWAAYSVVLIVIWLLNYLYHDSGGFLYIILNAIYIIVNVYCLIIWIIEYKKNKKATNVEKTL